MKMKRLSDRLKPPCSRCPYKLGLIHTLVNPCPSCRVHGYKSFEWFRKQISGSGK